MLKPAAQAILTRLNAEPLLLAPSYAGVLQDIASVDDQVKSDDERLEAHALDLMAVFGVSVEREKPFNFADGVAFIPVHGSLLNRVNWAGYSYTGYGFIRRQMEAAMADPDVKGIVFDMNSPGGEAQGCFELADMIYASRGKKPIAAVVDANSYSAAYALASAADKIYVTPSGGAGSIGVVTMHVDMSTFVDKMGFKVTYIYAGKHKVDGNPFAPLPDDVRASIQARIDQRYEEFVAQVARNRGLSAEKVRGTEAQVYSAKDALALGLIDSVMTPREALAAFQSTLSGVSSSTLMEKTTMADQDQKPEAKATPDVSGERARIASILKSDEAKGRADLANHLAFNTEMSADEAKAILAAAPVAKPEATEKAAPANPFAAAMASTPNPNVGAGDDAADKAEDPVKSFLAAHTAATGIKH